MSALVRYASRARAGTRPAPTIFLIVAAFAGCGPGADSQGPPARAPRPERTLSIGLIPEQNIFRQRERYAPIARYLGERVGVTIKLRPLERYGNIIENFRNGRLDGAFFGSFTYALAHLKLDVDVVARPETDDGVSTYHGLILVRRQSGIKSARDLRGKRFAFVDRATTAGYLLPLDFLARAGVRDIEAFLGETYFAGTHEDVIHDVVTGKADAGAAKSTVLQRMIAAEPGLAEQLVVLDRSPEVPENALALGPTVEPELRARIRAALLAMHEDADGRAVLARFGARRFIPTADSDYEPVYRYAREAGLDLATYDYDNSR